MEILKRAKGNSGEVIPFGTPPVGLQDELNHRTYKAGYTNREGGPVSSGRIIMKPATEQYRKNYKRIFGHD